MVSSFGASKWQQFSKVVFPSAVPTIIATLKVNIGFSLIGAIEIPIALGQALLLDYDDQLIGLATGSCIVRSRCASSTSGTSGPGLKPTRAGTSNSLAT